MSRGGQRSGHHCLDVFFFLVRDILRQKIPARTSKSPAIMLPEVVTFGRLYEVLQPVPNQRKVDRAQPQAIEVGSAWKCLREQRQPRHVSMSTKQPVKERGATAPHTDDEYGRFNSVGHFSPVPPGTVLGIF